MKIEFRFVIVSSIIFAVLFPLSMRVMNGSIISISSWLISVLLFSALTPAIAKLIDKFKNGGRG